MRINKIGQSANLILLVGVLLATAVSAFAVYTTFDDIVRDMVMGDPDVAAREFASNMDLVASAPNEISVYTSTPLTALGYPAFGTILLNAEDKKIRVHPWPQDLIKMQIQKSMYGEVSAEEAVGLFVLNSFRGSNVAMKAQQAVYQEVADKATREAAEAATEKSKNIAKKRADKFGLAAKKIGEKIKPTTAAGKAKRFIRKPVSSTARAIYGAGMWAYKKIAAKVLARRMGTAIAVESAAVVTLVGAQAAAEVSDIPEEIACATAATNPVSAGACATISISRRIVFGVLAATIAVITIYPIEHSIRNSRNARNEIDKKFGEYSFHTGTIPIHVAKPNCESKRYSIDSEVDLPWIGWVPGLEGFIGSAMNIPMSESTGEIKSYKSITNKGDECYDAHNVYLNQDGSFFYKILGATEGVIDGTGSTAISSGQAGTSNTLIHPYRLLVIAPFATCVTMGIIEPKYGNSCILAYDLMTISVWSNNELFGEGSWESVKDNWGGNLFLDGIVGAIAIRTRNPALFPIFFALNHLAPLDSATLFSYLTGSPSLIDSQKEYYMEDAILITISKEFDEEEKEYVLVIDKEI
jgi:hypothetical protein